MGRVKLWSVLRRRCGCIWRGSKNLLIHLIHIKGDNPLPMLSPQVSKYNGYETNADFPKSGNDREFAYNKGAISRLKQALIDVKQSG